MSLQALPSPSLPGGGYFFLVLVAGLLTAATTTNADVPRPRGVPLVRASLYQPRADQSWVCLDGKRTIRWAQINDDYCDCGDGSDEPGTAACPQAQFHCVNAGHKPLDVPSSRVNDGVCDCCDGQDEYGGQVRCENTCQRLGQAERELRKSRAELHKKGSAKRSELISKGKQLKAERDARRAELERRRHEQESLKAEKEQLKKLAEQAEAEALELYREQHHEEPAKVEEAGDSGPELMRAEALASFVFYDKNKDGFVEVTELQVDMRLDRNRDGVVMIEEAKYFLDERDRVDQETFVSLSWPRIKPIQMLAEGLFKPPVAGDEADTAELLDDPEKAPQHPHIEGTEPGEADPEVQAHHEDDDEEEEGEGYIDEELTDDADVDADVGVGSVEPDSATPAPEYDPETQHLIDTANEARRVFTEVENAIRDIEHEIKDLDEHDSKDYGPNEEYASMDGECYAFEDREYVYTLCPFDRASQKQRSGGSETTLGRWDEWVLENGSKYGKQRYAHGASCWNGPQRSAIVQLKCALESRIVSVAEPNRCEYHFEFETPAACDAAADEAQDQHDEL